MLRDGFRLPFLLSRSAGGLASALRSCIASYEEALWIGWPGCVPSSEDQERLTKRLAEASASWNCRMIPVWLQQGDVDDFYTGFSNSSLWPLMHWMTTNARFKRVWAEAYRRVNEQFADVILTEATPMDLVWIHDYHLFLVPQMLRKKRDIKLVQAEAEKSGLVQLERPGHLPPELPHADADVRHVKRPEGLPSTPEDAEESEAQPAAAHSTSETFEEPMSSNSPKAERHAFKSCTDRLTLLGEEEKPAEEDSAEKPGRDGYPNASMKKMRRSITQVEMASKLRIAFFLHTPFPGYEVLCVLPQCVDVVEGVLGADLVGFHTYNYLRHFRSCVIRLCGFTPDIDHVDHRGQRTHLGVFPIGANVNDIMDAMKTETFAQHLKEYTEQFQGKSLVLNVERLDYSKGLPQKLAAIQRYLEEAKKSAEDEDAQRTDRIEELQKRIDRLDKHKANRGLATSNLRRIGANVMKMLMGDFERPAMETELDHNKTVFVFIAVPSRRDVEEYQKIEEEVHRSISTINGNFSTLSHQPIVYIHRGVPMPELAALYARADCCLVTPLIDGMNLVAKEFIAAKDRSIDKVVPGTVVLSELAGAAQELFDAIVVNPYDDDAVADAIAIGLELTRGNRLSEDQRWEVTERMRQSIIENDSAAWGRSMLAELENPLQGSRIARPERLAMQYLQDHCAQKFFATRPGLKALFLDYDGTLREFEAKPEDAVPTEETQEMLARLARRDDLKLYIVSGRNRDFLEKHFGDLATLTLIAEHGYFKRGPDTDGKWVEFTPYSTLDWMDKIRPVLEMFTRCTPGAYIEHKASAIVWHYRDCDEDHTQRPLQV
ncbi:tpsp [Symbiodinium sp. CCMP2592]|nr:tpsp [Symbiodinium sp. CCMP2592]